MSLPAGTYGLAEFAYLDAGNEIGRGKCYGEILSAGNFVAQQGKWNTLLAAMDAVALGERVSDRYGNDRTFVAVQPTNGAAREIKLLIQLQDSVNGQRGTMTVPTLNPALPDYVQNTNAKDVVQVDTPTEIATLVAAVEAFCINPASGNAYNVVGLKVVGRNT